MIIVMIEIKLSLTHHFFPFVVIFASVNFSTSRRQKHLKLKCLLKNNFKIKSNFKNNLCNHKVIRIFIRSVRPEY